MLVVADNIADLPVHYTGTETVSRAQQENPFSLAVKCEIS